MYGLHHISVGNDGTLWGADNNDGSLHRRDGNSWHKDPIGHAEVVAAVSKDEVWTVNAGGEIHHLQNNAWPKVSAGAKWISVGAIDGRVWYADNIDGTLFFRENNGWKKLDEVGKAVVIAPSAKLWSVNKEHQVWHFSNAGWQQDTGAVDARFIAAGADGTVWYINGSGALFHRESSSPENKWANGPAGGIAIAVAVRNKAEVWCVNGAGELFKLGNNNWAPTPGPQPTVVQVPQATWTYAVRDRDTLSIIAAREYNTNDWARVIRINAEVVRLNNLPNKGNNIARPMTLTMPHRSYK